MSKYKLMVISVVLLAGMMFTGCSTVKQWSADVQDWYSAKQLEWREARQKELKQLAALPPAQMVVVSPKPDITNCAITNAICAKLSCDLFNMAQPKMKAYIAFAETSREYTGFVNDIQYYMEEEKLPVQEACKKVADAVKAADAKRPDDQKIWPKIVKGVNAARTLGTENQLAPIMELSSRRLGVSAMLGKNLKRMDKLQKKFKDAKKKKEIDENTYRQCIGVIMSRRAECAAINNQLNLTSRCISFMRDQYSRMKDLEKYAAE